MVHGAAGTGALMLLVLSTIRTTSLAFLYILIFGFGSVAGMLLISLLLAIPMQWAVNNVTSGSRVVQTAAGVLSCVFGIYLGSGILLHL
jgi:high-affinity nickel-transport protein